MRSGLSSKGTLPSRGHSLAAAEGLAAGRRARRAEPSRGDAAVRAADARRPRPVPDRGGVPGRPGPRCERRAEILVNSRRYYDVN